MFAESCITEWNKGIESEVTSSNQMLFWPSPPDTPRIQYLKSITVPADIGVRKSWFESTLDAVFGKEEAESGMMLRPYGVFADSHRIYVTDPGLNLLHVFDLKEKSYFQIEKAQEEMLISPIGVSTDKNGDIYVSDSFFRKVFVFDNRGKYLKKIGSSDLFVRPAGIAIYEARIYVVDTHSHQVFVLNRQDGNLLFRFGKNGQGQGEFNYPTNIFIGIDGLIYITDSMNFRIQIFDRDGKFLSSFGNPGDGPGDLSKPKGIAVDSDGNIYIADAHFDNVQIFDKSGRLLLIFGNTGRKNGEFILPAGVFIDERDRIYVADSYNKRIQIFQYLKEKK
jgi:DNA-binding beta-propeller fold protein YncE